MRHDFEPIDKTVRIKLNYHQLRITRATQSGFFSSAYSCEGTHTVSLGRKTGRHNIIKKGQLSAFPSVSMLLVSRSFCHVISREEFKSIMKERRIIPKEQATTKTPAFFWLIFLSAHHYNVLHFSNNISCCVCACVCLCLLKELTINGCGYQYIH
jgi:hypothetical protein